MQKLALILTMIYMQEFHFICLFLIFFSRSLFKEVKLYVITKEYIPLNTDEMFKLTSLLLARRSVAVGQKRKRRRVRNMWKDDEFQRIQNDKVELSVAGNHIYI